MATVTKTIIRIPTQDFQAWIPGDFSVANIQSMYSPQFPGLSAMTGSATEAEGPTGLERTVTFLPRQGQKG